MKNLNLGHNQLSGALRGIEKLLKLEDLFLHNNHFSEFPLELCQLTKLKTLMFRHNRLSTLPAEIEKLTNLTGLYLDGNPLPIPREVLKENDPEEIINYYLRENLNLPDRHYKPFISRKSIDKFFTEFNELEFQFQVCLRVVMVNPVEHNDLIKSYDLNKPDAEIRDKLIKLVEEGISSPKETGVYTSAIESNTEENIALQSVKLTGLIALVFLGKRTVIPQLLTCLREDKSKNVKRKIVAGMALRYLTGENIGDPIREEIIELWRQWWWIQNN